MSEWQPIETAPKDGTKILIHVQGCVIEAWHDKYCSNEGGWEVVTIDSHGCGCCYHANEMPTHWMPLPAPPQVQP